MARHPRYSSELRKQALAAYREHGSYRKAGKAIGRSAKRTRELAREGLRAEMAAATAARKELTP